MKLGKWVFMLAARSALAARANMAPRGNEGFTMARSNLRALHAIRLSAICHEQEREVSGDSGTR
jgi:hypothetical protein